MEILASTDMIQTGRPKRMLKLMHFAQGLRTHLLRLVQGSSAKVEQHHLHTRSITSKTKQRHQIQSISELARMC